MYVAVMMALAEATAPNGTVIGAVFTLLLYGIAPLALVMYLLGTPMRRRALRAAEAQELAAQQAAAKADAPTAEASGHAPDQGSLPPGDGITPK